MSPMPPNRHCDKKEPHDCGKSAVAHVFPFNGEPPTNFYCCAQHRDEALKTLRAIGTGQIHKLGPDCGMPGAEFNPAENVCEYGGDLPVTTVDSAIPARV